MAERTRTRPLSIYLLDAELSAPDEAVRTSQSVRKVAIGRGRGSLGTLFYRTTPLRSPAWTEFFGSHIDPNDLRSSGVAAVFVVRAGGRVFALTFGHGRHLLESESYEEGFGLRVTLNSVSPERIRTIDRKAIDATGRHSRDQASRNIPIIEFGLDIDKDILRAVTGPPEDETLGRRFAGADALAVVAETDLRNLRAFLERLLVQYQGTVYRDRFPWVDNIREVRQPTLRDQLDRDLVQRIRDRRLERIWLAVPELVDWNDVAGFTYLRAEDTQRYDDVDFESYLAEVGDLTELTLETLRRHKVLWISAGTDLPRDEWPVYRCVYAEIERENKVFLLNAARWYQINSDYVEEVNAAIARIPASRAITFPMYEDQSEAEYNRRVHESDPETFALMDRKTVRYGGGSSQIEFCDLYSSRHEMIHVKRYSGSSALSHLFSQGAVSGSLLLNDARFRAEVNRILPVSHRLPTPGAQPSAAEYEVAYAIASRVREPLVLPFFSRVTLKSTFQQLRNVGYRVTLTKIQCR